ncbi:T9SS type A sorting domain-containing protein [Bacteroides salyersiae]|uniref:T9SS type A sorting domain-containing protein n=1 Tax=Bacteroides salyersiae TaxID=291644 RepID=UPI001C8C7B22|nr:T9SS type A sorting domain-containing protein [Bacteroides salyersiae]
MKLFLFFMLTVLAPLQLFSQYSLERTTHLPRPGDRLGKQEVSYKSPGAKGTGIVWDFSELENRNANYELRYTSPHPGSDTIIGIEHRTMYRYQLSGDTLFTPGYENSTTRIGYRIPESLLVFPFPYGRSLTTSFGGKGNYCNRLGIDICGRSTVTADATGLMILPGGDTLHHVLRVHTCKLVFERTGPGPAHAVADLDTVIGPVCYRDSVNRYLADDSAHFQIDTWRWYAEGYRYPVFESIHSAICKSGKKSTHFSTSFYYPPKEQYYGLSGDPENQERRDRREMDHHPEAFPAADSEKKDSGHEYEDEFIRYVCISDGQEVSLSYTLKTDSDVGIELYDIQGRRYTAVQKTCQSAGSYREQLPLGGLPAGEYLLRIAVGDKTYGEKILKR